MIIFKLKSKIRIEKIANRENIFNMVLNENHMLFLAYTSFCFSLEKEKLKNFQQKIIK